MSWFGSRKTDEPEEIDPPPPPRTASDEYLAGLKFIADIYESRAKSAKAVMVERANRIAAATNFERVTSDAAEIQQAADRGRVAQGLAEEVRGWIGDFEFRGYRPPHLPPLPPDPASESQGE